MRISKQEEIGAAGESAVALQFQEIGWGPVPRGQVDYGTDFFVQVRSARRFDLGLVCGVQVKTGKSYFRSQKIDEDGSVLGWWYYEQTPAHFNYWVRHALPHLLVLHNDKTGVSYWVHVTADALLRAGKGWKILVPANQTVDQEHRDDLLSAASTLRARPSLEGTAFMGPDRAVAPGDRLRYALVAPRLIAPHPNAGYRSTIDDVEAVALLAQGRFRDLKRFAEKLRCVPDPENSGPDLAWGWQFVAAMWDWAMTDSTKQLRTAFHSSPDKSAMAASGVLLSCALQRLEQYDEAAEVLDQLTESDELEAVEHGWVLVQRARARAEIGDIDQSRHDANQAKESLVSQKDDITVSAFTAAADFHLAAAGDFRDVNVGALVTASDTNVSWWRSQMISQALIESAKSRFQSWAGSEPLVVFGGNSEALDLFAAELNADITGEQARWRGISALGARQRLLRASTSRNEAGELVEGLNALRRSGDSQSLKLAMGHLYRVGPIEPVVKAVKNIPVSGWTHTTAAGNFQALAVAGDLLDEQIATKLLFQSARIVGCSAEDFMNRVRPTFVVPYYALDAVAGLLPAAADGAHGAIARLFVELSNLHPDMLVTKAKSTLHQIDSDLVSAPDRKALWEVGQRDQDRVGVAVLSWFVVNGNPDAWEQLAGRAADGDNCAIGAIDDVTELNDTQAAPIIAHLEGEVKKVLEDARRHSYNLARTGRINMLTRLNLWFPDFARWEVIVELLCEPFMTASDKRSACLPIIRSSDRLPPEVQAYLVSRIECLETAASSFLDKDGIGGMGVLLGTAIGAINSHDANAAVAQLACGSPLERDDAALLLGLELCPRMQPVLAALAGDKHLDVRSSAAAAVGRLAANTPTQHIHTLAHEIASKGGIYVPLMLLSRMFPKRGQPVSDVSLDIAQTFLQHPSARLRHLADRLLQIA